MALHHRKVSRMRGHITFQCERKQVLCLPIQIIPNGIELLVFRHLDNAECVSLPTCDRSGGFNVTCVGLVVEDGESLLRLHPSWRQASQSPPSRSSDTSRPTCQSRSKTAEPRYHLERQGRQPIIAPILR